MVAARDIDTPADAIGAIPRDYNSSVSSSDARDRHHSATLRPRPPDMPPPGGRRDRTPSMPRPLGKKLRCRSPEAVYYRAESDGER